MHRSWRNRWRAQTVMLVVAVGTAGAWKPPIVKAVKGYNGCFDKEGALIRQFDKDGAPIRDLEAHVAAGKPVILPAAQRTEESTQLLPEHAAPGLRAIPEVFVPLDDEERCEAH